MSEKIVSHIDEKANKIKGFDLLANYIWRRANYLVKTNFKPNEQIMVIDPCAGGGKLISGMQKTYMGKAYEPNYSPFMYAKYMLDQKNFEVDVVNEPFEFHFTTPALPQFHLAVSIPYTDREINTIFEKDKSLLKMKNYCYYIMYKTIAILQDGGFGVFAIPRELVNIEYFQDEIKMIAEKTTIMSSEGYEDFVILIIKKNR